MAAEVEVWAAATAWVEAVVQEVREGSGTGTGRIPDP